MISLAEVVLRQTTLYNGHGQLEVSEMSLSDIRQLSVDLGEGGLRDIYIKLYPEGGGRLSCSIYEESVLDGKDKLWFGVENVIMDSEEG